MEICWSPATSSVLCPQSCLQGIRKMTSQLPSGISVAVLLGTKYGRGLFTIAPASWTVGRMVVPYAVETGWTWPPVSARSPLSHIWNLAGLNRRSAWFHLGTCCGLLLTIWLCKLIPFEHDQDKITLGLCLVWFVCEVLKARYRIFLLYKIEASLEVMSFLWFTNQIIFHFVRPIVQCLIETGDKILC